MSKRILIKAGIIVAVIVIAVAVPLLVGLSKISNIELKIQNTEGPKILTETEILNELSKKYGNFLTYKRNKIDTDDIKEYLEHNDFIKNAVVSVSLTGELRITIVQKTIIVRVYNKSNHNFYIDDEMDIIKTIKPVQCLTAIGDIKDNPVLHIDTIKNGDSKIIYDIATLINADNLLKKWISGIMKKDKNWFLIPTQGDYVIRLGDKKEWKEELEKLHYLINYSFETQGWDDYEYIDLRFHNQIICGKYK
ncbi:MAG: cell division protein FtsQ/DivIB [Bacteroidales bacterium]|nr:cell division protein FtsQ/DivIB [Bacteroidales bacterium]